jgi:hypothetical protein
MIFSWFFCSGLVVIASPFTVIIAFEPLIFGLSMTVLVLSSLGANIAECEQLTKSARPRRARTSMDY